MYVICSYKRDTNLIQLLISTKARGVLNLTSERSLLIVTILYKNLDKLNNSKIGELNLKHKINTQKNQTKSFANESKRYVSSYINHKSSYEFEISKKIDSNDVDSLLDVGCGNGEVLNKLKNHFNITSAVGIEPRWQEQIL